VPTAAITPSRSIATRSAICTVDGRCATTNAVTPPSTPTQRRLDLGFGVHVERRQRVVQHQHRRVAQHRAGQREPLPLAARQREPLLTDPRGKAPRSAATNPSALATRSAAQISSSGASGLPNATFSRTLAEISTGSSNAVATTRRSWPSATSRTSMPSISTRPAVRRRGAGRAP